MEGRLTGNIPLGAGGPWNTASARGGTFRRANAFRESSRCLATQVAVVEP